MSPLGAQLFEVMQRCAADAAPFAELDRALTQAVRRHVAAVAGDQQPVADTAPPCHEAAIGA